MLQGEAHHDGTIAASRLDFAAGLAAGQEHLDNPAVRAKRYRAVIGDAPVCERQAEGRTAIGEGKAGHLDAHDVSGAIVTRVNALTPNCLRITSSVTWVSWT